MQVIIFCNSENGSIFLKFNLEEEIKPCVGLAL